MDVQEIKRASLELLKSADAAYVTTVDDKSRPHTRCMFNLRNEKKFPKLVEMFKAHENDFMILLSTNTSSAKVEHIKKNPAVCIYYCKPAEFHGLMLAGDVEIINNPEVKEGLWHDGWERYYPAGPHDPDHTVLRLIPSTAKGWYNGRIFTLEFGDTT